MIAPGILAELGRGVDEARAALVEAVRDMVRLPTENPPSDTAAIAALLHDRLACIDGIEIETPCLESPVVNLFARIRGASPGRSLAFNGHLDTYVVRTPAPAAGTPAPPPPPPSTTDVSTGVAHAT